MHSLFANTNGSNKIPDLLLVITILFDIEVQKTKDGELILPRNIGLKNKIHICSFSVFLQHLSTKISQKFSDENLSYILIINTFLGL